MTEKELNAMYTRLAFQYNATVSTLLDKTKVDESFTHKFREEFFDSSNEEKLKDYKRMKTYQETTRRYIRDNAHDQKVSLIVIAKEYSTESPGLLFRTGCGAEIRWIFFGNGNSIGIRTLMIRLAVR